MEYPNLRITPNSILHITYKFNVYTHLSTCEDACQ